VTVPDPIVVASNRGPIAFSRDSDGSVVARRGVGGLVTAVSGALRGRDAAWVAAAITDEDRLRAAEGPLDLDVDGESMRVRLVALEEKLYESYYNEFCNRILWFLHHYLWDTARAPSFASEFSSAWEDFRTVNDRFADLVTEESREGAVALPQDYHLSLVPGALRARKPELNIASFWHIPFCQPDQFRLLPDEWGTSLLEGMLAADVIGFQAQRWASNFIACCQDVLGVTVKGRAVSYQGHVARVGIYPVGVNVDLLQEQASSPEARAAEQRIDELVAGRTLILRVDRTELSKNILRGLMAFELLLERRPDLHGTLVHLVLLTPSRRDVPEYDEYMRLCTAQADRINDRFATADWQPLIVDESDDYPATLAAYKRYDVLVVNPVYDGMNLVAREGPCLNERDGVLVLSRNAGAAAELGAGALLVNPFDPDGTALMLDRALALDADERAARAARLRELAPGVSPERWLNTQIKDAQRRRGV
jgi:trehalose 6-phosphate synthase